MGEEEKDWVTEVEKEKEKIKKWEITDRLSLVSKLTFMNGSLASSVTGWNSWLTNAIIMEKLTEKELKDLVASFEELTLAFLDLDVKYTKLLKERYRTEKTKEAEEEEKKTKKKTTYVA